MASLKKSDSPEREHARYTIVSRVRVRMESWDEFEELYTNNVSSGGMFIRMDKPTPVGTRVSVELSDAGGRTMVLPAEVAHTDSVDGDPNRGVGLRFLSLSDAEREIVDALVEEARSVRAAGSMRDAALSDGVPDMLSRLEAELARVNDAEPHDALGVAPDVERGTLDEARRELIAHWHPSNFARESREVLDAATELCRALNRAWTSARAKLPPQ